MGRLDIQGDFDRPAGVGRGQSRASRFIHLAEARGRRQAVCGIERGQIAANIRIVVGIDDGDGLAAAVDGRAAGQPNLVEAVSVTDLAGTDSLRIGAA
jgi:hypothetical protein